MLLRSTNSIRCHCQSCYHAGRQDACEATLEALKTLPTEFCQFASILVESCSKAGTGDVLAVQNLLHICSEHFGESSAKKKDEKPSEEKGPSASRSPPSAPSAAPGAVPTPSVTVTDGTGEKENAIELFCVLVRFHFECFLF